MHIHWKSIQLFLHLLESDATTQVKLKPKVTYEETSDLKHKPF